LPSMYLRAAILFIFYYVILPACKYREFGIISSKISKIITSTVGNPLLSVVLMILVTINLFGNILYVNTGSIFYSIRLSLSLTM